MNRPFFLRMVLDRVVVGAIAGVRLGQAAPPAQPHAPIPEPYRVTAARIPDKDLSGRLGPRLLKLLSNQVARNLGIMENDRVKAGIEVPGAIASGTPYFEYSVAGTACT